MKKKKQGSGCDLATIVTRSWWHSVLSPRHLPRSWGVSWPGSSICPRTHHDRGQVRGSIPFPCHDLGHDHGQGLCEKNQIFNSLKPPFAQPFSHTTKFYSLHEIFFKKFIFCSFSCILKSKSSIALQFWGKEIQFFHLLAFQTMISLAMNMLEIGDSCYIDCCSEILVYMSLLWVGENIYGCNLWIFALEYGFWDWRMNPSFEIGDFHVGLLMHGWMLKLIHELCLVMLDLIIDGRNFGCLELHCCNLKLWSMNVLENLECVDLLTFWTCMYCE